LSLNILICPTAWSRHCSRSCWPCFILVALQSRQGSWQILWSPIIASQGPCRLQVRSLNCFGGLLFSQHVLMSFYFSNLLLTTNAGRLLLISRQLVLSLFNLMNPHLSWILKLTSYKHLLMHMRHLHLPLKVSMFLLRPTSLIFPLRHTRPSHLWVVSPLMDLI